MQASSPSKRLQVLHQLLRDGQSLRVEALYLVTLCRRFSPTEQMFTWPCDSNSLITFAIGDRRCSGPLARQPNRDEHSHHLQSLSSLHRQQSPNIVYDHDEDEKLGKHRDRKEPLVDQEAADCVRIVIFVPFATRHEQG